MFETFTKEARGAVVAAQAVARDLRSGSIDARHVLVALAEGGGPAADALSAAGVEPARLARALRERIAAGDVLDGEALAALGVDLDAVRARADAVFGEGALDRAATARRRGPRGHIPFTSDAKKALELSLREAIRLERKGIDGGMLLLGVLRGGGPALEALEHVAADAGTDAAAVRAAVERERPAA